MGLVLPEISIVVPVYNEEGNVEELLERLFSIMSGLTTVTAFEFVVVNDGSTDGTLERMKPLLARFPMLRIVNLSRNFGHQLAATAGLDAARGEAVILMDGDLQDPPELIADFIAHWRAGYDVVYAMRRKRDGESRFKLITASLFYRVIRRLTNVAIPVDTGDFRLMSRRVLVALSHVRERHRFLRGLVSWVGYRQIGVGYDRAERFSGTTKYPLSKMIKFALDGITSFSEIPLRFATYLGFVTSGFAFMYLLIVLILNILHLNLQGYTSTMAAILFLGGVQLIGIGILGEYIGRIYDEVKGRPLYLVADVLSADGVIAE